VFVTYRVADGGVADFVGALRRLGEQRLEEVQQIARAFVEKRGNLEAIDRQRLYERVRAVHFGRPHVVEASALTLPFGESTFEVVTASFVLSHLFARHTLGAGEWSRFQDRVRGELRRRFGPVFECSRGVLIGLGRRAAREDAKPPATPATE
jgi:hypothetical protein